MSQDTRATSLAEHAEFVAPVPRTLYGRSYVGARKHPLRMARIAGLALFAPFLLGHLPIDRIEQRPREVSGPRVRAVRGCARELSCYADKVHDDRCACEKP